MEKEINQLRYFPLPNLLRAARYHPVIMGVYDLEADLSMMGLKGSPTSVTKIFAPPQRSRGEIISGDDDRVVHHLVEKLSDNAVLNT